MMVTPKEVTPETVVSMVEKVPVVVSSTPTAPASWVTHVARSIFTAGVSNERPKEFLAAVQAQDDNHKLPMTITHYFFQITSTILIATVIGVLPLVLPIKADFTTGYWSAFTYWFMYNGPAGGALLATCIKSLPVSTHHSCCNVAPQFCCKPLLTVIPIACVAAVYALASYERLGSLMPGLCKTNRLKLGLLAPKVLLAAGLGMIIVAGGFMLLDFIVCSITRTPSPAPGLMIFAAPVTLSSVDLMFPFLLKETSKGELKTHLVGMLLYSILVGAPIFACLVPIFLASIKKIRGVVVVVFVAFLWPKLKYWFFTTSKYVLHRFYFSKLKDIGKPPKNYFAMKNLYDLYLGMACLLLFPFRDLSSINVLFLQCLNVYRGQKKAVQDIINQAKKEYDMRGQADGQMKKRNSEITATDVKGRVKKRNSEITASDVESAVASELQMSEPMYEKITCLVNMHIVDSATSFVYLVLTTTLFWRGNRGQYYVYECMTVDDWIQASVIVAIKFSWEIGNIAHDLMILRKYGLLSHFLKVAIYTHDMTRMNLALTISLTCVIFTSCFYIKYDGMFFLSTIADCNGIVDWKNDVWRHLDGANMTERTSDTVSSLVNQGLYPASF